MLISNEWLKDYVDVEQDVQDLAERITRTGIELDDLVDLTKDIKNLVVGHVISKASHPDADKLNICQVDIGEKRLYKSFVVHPMLMKDNMSLLLKWVADYLVELKLNELNYVVNALKV